MVLASTHFVVGTDRFVPQYFASCFYIFCILLRTIGKLVLVDLLICNFLMRFFMFAGKENEIKLKIRCSKVEARAIETLQSVFLRPQIIREGHTASRFMSGNSDCRS